MKTRGIDTQKGTLACICYAMGRIGAAGKMRNICVRKLHIICLPTNLVSYISPFLHVNTTSFCFYLVYYFINFFMKSGSILG